VPKDDYLQRASRSGRAVVDVFPKADAAMAFSRLAQRMASHAADYELA
jgi:flagellar biosynthesis protein FlhG